MLLKKTLQWLALLPLLASVAWAKSVEVQTLEFKDGKDFYSYTNALNIALPQDGKVLIQYFFKYDCDPCILANDHLTTYAKRNPDKVVLQRAPAFEQGNAFTAHLYESFLALGREDLGLLYLFDSAGRKAANSLVKNDAAIAKWLKDHQLDVAEFDRIFHSPEVKAQVEKAAAHYNQYMPPVIPIAVLNGKYILARNTLENDDYTFAVLDFLVHKLTQEKNNKESK